MDLYAQNIMDHMKHPHHSGSLLHPTSTHKELNPFCGDEVEVDIEVKEGKIHEIAFRGQGCAISQAAISILTDELGEMTTTEVLALGEQEIQDMLGIQLTQRRKKCALLGLLAIQNAILKNEDKTLKTWRDLFID